MILFKAIEIFFSLCWHEPDLHLPLEYRQSKISFFTALRVSCSWFIAQINKNEVLKQMGQLILWQIIGLSLVSAFLYFLISGKLDFLLR